MPFLTFLTRACCRPAMLAACIDSVRAQSDPDWEQVFVVDKEQRGLVWANNAMERNAHRVRGEWVYHLDDDTRLLDAQFVARVKAHVAEHPRSEVVVVRSRRPQMASKVLPNEKVWGNERRLPFRCNSLCHVTRADVWRACIPTFSGGGGGSGRLVAAFLNAAAEITWLDTKPVAETQQLGRGHKFENCRGDWWEKTVKRFGIRDTTQTGDWRLAP